VAAGSGVHHVDSIQSQPIQVHAAERPLPVQDPFPCPRPSLGLTPSSSSYSGALPGDPSPARGSLFWAASKRLSCGFLVSGMWKGAQRPGALIFLLDA
jgi:hypothetical protein